MDCIEKFREIYRADPEAAAFCPYRVCPLGAHVDHQLGRITGFAIDKGIRIVYTPAADGTVELTSLQYEKSVRFQVNSVPESKVGDWADHLRGAAAALGRRFPLQTGLSGVIEGTLPIGGLSSSAAVILSFLSALCAVNHVSPTEAELIDTAREAENVYVGVSCGKLDQSCEVYCRKDSLLYMDTLDGSYENIMINKTAKPFEIMILFSGLERTLAGSKYNLRVDECKSAAYALQAYSGADYGKFGEAYLRDVPQEVYLRYRDRLPESWRKRAEHYFTENERVLRGAEAWTRGDIETFGKLVFESGASSIDNYEAGSEEFRVLYRLMRECDGIYGGRFSGAGFRGSCMALVDPGQRDRIAEYITKKYIGEFPGLSDAFSVFFCQTADGVGNKAIR